MAVAYLLVPFESSLTCSSGRVLNASSFIHCNRSTLPMLPPSSLTLDINPMSLICSSSNSFFALRFCTVCLCAFRVAYTAWGDTNLLNVVTSGRVCNCECAKADGVRRPPWKGDDVDLDTLWSLSFKDTPCRDADQGVPASSNRVNCSLRQSMVPASAFKVLRMWLCIAFSAGSNATDRCLLFMSALQLASKLSSSLLGPSPLWNKARLAICCVIAFSPCTSNKDSSRPSKAPSSSYTHKAPFIWKEILQSVQDVITTISRFGKILHRAQN